MSIPDPLLPVVRLPDQPLAAYPNTTFYKINAEAIALPTNGPGPRQVLVTLKDPLTGTPIGQTDPPVLMYCHSGSDPGELVDVKHDIIVGCNVAFAASPQVPLLDFDFD